MREIQLDLCVIIISEEQVCNTQQACGKQSDLQRGMLTDGADVLLLLLHWSATDGRSPAPRHRCLRSSSSKTAARSCSYHPSPWVSPSSFCSAPLAAMCDLGCRCGCSQSRCPKSNSHQEDTLILIYSQDCSIWRGKNEKELHFLPSRSWSKTERRSLRCLRRRRSAMPSTCLFLDADVGAGDERAPPAHPDLTKKTILARQRGRGEGEAATRGEGRLRSGREGGVDAGEREVSTRARGRSVATAPESEARHHRTGFGQGDVDAGE